MMQFAHKYMQNVEGLIFYKLMGTGKGNGFNPYPDWSTYALLSVWENEEKAKVFVSHSELFKKYKAHSGACGTLYLRAIKAHGYWSGQQPFEINNISSIDGQICALTRATIKKRYLRKFWKYVPTSSRPLEKNEDLLFTKGIGEVPIINMATFSIWSNENALNEFAYESREHHKAIRMTRELGWYKEELFSRFVISQTEGDYFSFLS